MSTATPGRETRPLSELRLPTEAERLQAEEALRLLAPLLVGSTPIRLVARPDEGDAIDSEIPRPALLLLGQILDGLSRGHTVRVKPIRPLIPIGMAADLLNAPESYVVDLIKSGKLPIRTDDPSGRIAFDDLMAFKKVDDEARERALDELVALGQEIGVGYEP